MSLTPEEIAERVEAWKKRLDLLGISHWRLDEVILVDDGEMPGGARADAAAAVFIPDRYDRCRFYFNNAYLDDASSADIDQSIVHEWLHVAMRDFDQALGVVEGWMPDQTYSDWEDRVNHEREGLVDRLAWQIVAGFSNTKS